MQGTQVVGLRPGTIGIVGEGSVKLRLRGRLVCGQGEALKYVAVPQIALR